MIATNTLPVILMLEHDDDDRFITNHVFEENKYNARLEFVNNGQAIFSYLNHSSEHHLPLPALILINLHTTPEDGREVLKQLKSDARYKHIPVVMLSGSKNPSVARECYALGASSFIQKPSLLSEAHDKITIFFRYWFNTVELV
jgi:CheY-like chemotaxis protein